MILIRLDADHTRGMGHLFRMILLAGQFRQVGFDCLFLLRENAVSRKVLSNASLPGRFFPTDSAEEDIIEAGLIEHGPPDLWIFDMLDTHTDWIHRIKRRATSVVCFDDREGGPLAADLVINAIVGCWDSSITGEHVLSGPRYAIIDPDILPLPRSRRLQTRDLRLGVSMGGSDTHGVTVKLAQVLTRLPDIDVTFFLGPHFLHEDDVQAVLAGNDCCCAVRRAVPDLHRELTAMDAVICGGGQTLFELCSLGMPILAFANEVHEEETIAFFERRRVCFNIGSRSLPIDTAGLQDILCRLAEGEVEIERMQTRARTLVDGKGLSRIVAACKDIMFP